jgi:cytochrome c peroxidase
MKRFLAIALVGATFATGSLAPGARRAFAADDAALLKEAQSQFKPLPKDFTTAETPATPERVALGRALFFDKRLSTDGSTSCSRCHPPEKHAADGLPKSIGVQGKLNPRNAPSILNAALQAPVHWRGDRKNVEDQAARSLTGATSFGNADAAAAVARIKAIPGYKDMFARAFPGEADPISVENAGKAIGAFERLLVTPSRFDAYLGGKIDALTPGERKGLAKFMENGCSACHNGAGLGGQSFQKFGVVEEYAKLTGSKTPDKGRFDVTRDEADMFVFKTSMLRNVARTAPYFHDGSVARLEDAVRIMARAQLGKTLSDEDVGDIVTFLGSLTGEAPELLAKAPELPK